MKASLESLSKVGAEFYAEAQAAAQAAQSAGAAGPAGEPQEGGPAPKTEKKADVVDADFEVVDDEKGKK
jgi:molecular chaperone DnaK